MPSAIDTLANLRSPANMTGGRRQGMTSPVTLDGLEDHGALYGSEFEDPGMVRNPHAFAIRSANADLRRRDAIADAAEYAADPERQRVDAIRGQLDEDYDLEYRAPRRIDIMGRNAVRDAQQRAQARRAGAEVEAEGSFDPWQAAASERDFERKQELYDAQYGRSADARLGAAAYGAQGRIGAAEAAGRARADSARITTQGRVRGQMVDDAGAVLPENAGKVESIDQFLGINAKPFPRALFQRFADQFFGGDATLADEALAAQGYYLAGD